MTTRRSFLSALVGLPLVGRFLRERKPWDLHPDMYRVSIKIPKGPLPAELNEYSNVYDHMTRDYARYYR